MTFYATVTDDELRATLEAISACNGNKTHAALKLGIPRGTLTSRVVQAQIRGIADGTPVNPPARAILRAEKPFSVDQVLPDPESPLEELIERCISEFNRKHAARQARKLIDINVKIAGPIGIAHFGDPHVDDPGSDFAKLQRHVEIVNKTEGMFGANVGDLQNLWIGRLARLYANQSATATDSWRLTEWLVRSVHWLYLIKGNHDLWAGAGDPLDWMVRSLDGVVEPHGARLNLRFPNGRQVRINARHDFKGHSMWNTAHAPAKAAQMGWRDHILTCGHRHVTGYHPVMDPATGMISHAIRVGAYKRIDDYADALGVMDQNFSENIVTVINPDATEEKGLVTVIFDLEEAADFLTFKRKRGNF